MPVLMKCVEAVELCVVPAAQFVALCGLIFSAINQKQTEGNCAVIKPRCNGCGVFAQRVRGPRPKIGIGIGKERAV
jgi:hypothetical protein